MKTIFRFVNFQFDFDWMTRKHIGTCVIFLVEICERKLGVHFKKLVKMLL